MSANMMYTHIIVQSTRAARTNTNITQISWISHAREISTQVVRDYSITSHRESAERCASAENVNSKPEFQCVRPSNEVFFASSHTHTPTTHS